MISHVCQIHRLKSAPTKAVIITTSLMKKLGCVSGTSIRISCGNKQVISRIVSVRDKPGDVIYVPPSVAHALALPTVPISRVSYHHKTLRLGPVIGILTTGYTGSPSQPYGGRTSLFKQFLTAGRRDAPIFFVFTPSMVNWQDETVTGWFIRYHPTLKQYIWKAERAPLPDVIYDRVPNRKKEMDPAVIACKERLRQRHRVRSFNQGFFNKWDVHERLYNHPSVSAYIPETIRSPDVSILKHMLDRHRMIYLKPSGGSLGIGIIRITYHPQSGYYCRYHTWYSQRNVLKRFTSLDHMLRTIFSRQTERMKRYIAQQGIRLIRYENRPVDFRLHMHKDRQNEWQVVGMAAKVAGTGSVTTHVRTGGSVMPAEQLFQAKYGHKGVELKHKLQQAAKEIATVLEKTTDGPLGELGMDMGLDVNHNVWLFEANAKPGRHIFYHPHLRAAGRESAYYITEYSLKLADFI